MAAPLVPLLARLAAGIGRASAGNLAGGLSGLGRATAARIPVARATLAGLGRRSAVRRALRLLPRPRRGSRAARGFTGRLTNAASALGQRLVVPRPVRNRAPGAPGGPQGPTLPPTWTPRPAPTPPPPPPPPGIPQVTLRGLTAVGNAGIRASVAIGSASLAAEKLASGLAERNRDLAPYSGKLAGGFAALDAQSYQLRARTAAATGGSGAELLKEVKKAREALQPIKEDLTNLVNMGGIALAKLAQLGGYSLTVSKAAGSFGLLLRVVEQINGYLAKDENASSGADEFMRGLLDPKFHQQAPPPPQLPPLV